MIAALGILIRTSVLLACVSLLSLALRRASASVRHALWVVALLAVLAFPIASRVLPEWDLAILPENTPRAIVFDTTPPPAPMPEPVTSHARLGSEPSSVTSNPVKSADVRPQIPSSTPWRWTQWLAIAWALGSLVFAFGWVKSLLDLHWLTQRSGTSTDDGLNAQLAEAQREIGVSGTIPLRIASEAIPPMTWGILRLVILLPAAAIDWSPVRQRLVLAHELAHVKRNDGLGQILAQSVSCIYWFNPLVWYAVRRLHAERERACDDCVLRLGADGADYADHLLQITRGLNSGFAQSAVSMAHPSQLKSRLIAILDFRIRRSRASRITASSLLTIVGVLTLTIAATQLTTLSTMVLPAFASPLGVPLWNPEPAVQVRAAATATPTPQQPAAAVDPHYEFLKQYCVSCHNSNDRVGNLEFDFGHFDTGGVADDRPRWEKVVRRLRAGMDPPLSASSHPSDVEIKSMIQFLETELDRNAKTYVPPIGPHRLNRTEYGNAIRDLLDLEIDATKLLQGDDSTRGFDNIAGALGPFPKAIEPYVGIAPVISRMAIQTATNSPSYQRVFVCSPDSRYGEFSEPCWRKIIGSLTENAFRGFAASSEVDSLVKQRGYLHFDSIASALTEILASPKFLYRTEDAPAGVKPGEAFRISDLALASRLSFFLWSTIPDQELIDVAKQGKLHEPAILEQQTLRMLKDYRADALSVNLAGQWLAVRAVQRITPSPAFFPEFDESLRQAMGREVELLFDSVVREDRNVTDLLTANDTFVNNKLARLYGIPNVTGSQFRRITLPEALDMRRGIVGKAAFLSVPEYGLKHNRTSPVGRGRFIMQTLLGVFPPDPAPNDPPLPERSNDPNVLEPSMRKSMEDLKSHYPTSRACVFCHQYTDPIGYSLENFNAIGIWRDADGGAPIDAADTLYDGTKINGPADLRRWLVSRSDQFVQVMTEKLMTYALGRGVEAQDMPLIRAIDREAARNNNRFSAIVLGIVKSDTFQMNSK
jgi:beta-lactamase regulating signal transducer with metallopeptidase domain/mono/diheme cytochrome c family protein